MPQLAQIAERLAETLAHYDRRLVLAESCTAGMAAAALAATPGISQWLCGSAVTYREQTKIDWLGVSADAITEFGVVSDVIARQMAIGVLERSVEADVAASVTGHLGPGAPAELDGVVCLAIAWRDAEGNGQAEAWQHRLSARHRLERQREAAILLLDRARESVTGEGI